MIIQTRVKQFVNIYADEVGRWISDEHYETYEEAFDNRDVVSTYIETVKITRYNNTNIMEQRELILNNWHKKDYEKVSLWTSDFVCKDGDLAELYVEKDGSGFELNPFSFDRFGYSKIIIEESDYALLWSIAYNDDNFNNFTYEQQSVLLANYFCELFCKRIG